MSIVKIAISRLCLLGLLILAGCSSPPSEAEVRQIIEHEISSNSNGLIRLNGFHKTNGIEQSAAGAKAYRMEWIADLEFTEDCYWSERADFKAVRITKNHLANMLNEIDKKKQMKGSRVSLSGVTTLEKTENGWR